MSLLGCDFAEHFGLQNEPLTPKTFPDDGGCDGGDGDDPDGACW